MERERATMRRSMLVAQQQLTTAQAEAADVRGANSKALAQAEDAVLQLQRRLTEQATTLAMGALEVDELRESVHKSAQQQVRLVVLLADNAVSDAQRHNALTSDACAVGQEADGRTISQLTAQREQLSADRQEDKDELKKLRAAVTSAAVIGADRERLSGVVAQHRAEAAEQARELAALREQLDAERGARKAAELMAAQAIESNMGTRPPPEDADASATAEHTDEIVVEQQQQHGDAHGTTVFEDAEEGEEICSTFSSAQMLPLSLSVQQAEEQLRRASAQERVLELQRMNDAAEAEAASLFSSDVWKSKQKFAMSPASRRLLEESNRGTLPPFEERQQVFEQQKAEWRAAQKLEAEVQRACCSILCAPAASESVPF